MISRLYGSFSLATSIAVIATPQSVEENLNWLIRAFFGITIAVIGYFVKRVMDERTNDRIRLHKVESAVVNNTLIINLWIEHFSQHIETIAEQVDERGGHVGRRASDIALANLLTTIRKAQEQGNGQVGD